MEWIQNKRRPSDLFKLQTDVIFFYTAHSSFAKECREYLGRFLFSIGHQKKFSELWQLYKAQWPDLYNSKQPSFDLYKHQMETSGFYFSGAYEDNEPLGVMIDQPIEVIKDAHPKYFLKLFPYAFYIQQEALRSEFLKHHLAHSFHNNHNHFRDFLNQLITFEVPEDKSLKAYIDRWIENNLSNFTTDESLSGATRLSTRQLAFILYIQVEADQVKITGNRKEFFKQHSDKITRVNTDGIVTRQSATSFKNCYYDIHSMFDSLKGEKKNKKSLTDAEKESIKQKLVTEIKDIIQYLTTSEEKRWANEKIKKFAPLD
jgi:hypothetical protein